MFAARALWAQWRKVSGQPIPPPSPGWLAASCVVVLATYALLIATWWFVLRLWGARVPIGEATRVWSVSNLGKYVPGKVWQISAMSVMLREHGVPLATGGAAAVVVTLANLVAGFALVIWLGRGALSIAVGVPAARATVVAVMLGAAALIALPLFGARVARPFAGGTGRRAALAAALRDAPLAAPALALLGCALSWASYGVAFQWFGRALLGRPLGDASAWTVAYALSYLVGYVAIFAPGGLGVRELALVASLESLHLVAPREAALLAVASRLWLTVLEVLPGVAFLAVRKRGRRGAAR